MMAEKDGEVKSDKPILVVDDDPFILDFLKTVLEAGGYAVLTASDGREALEVMDSEQPGLILLDLSMPVLDGSGFLEQMRLKPPPRPPVVVMSAFDNTRSLARQLDAEGWLQKPFDLDTLLGIVDRLLR